MSTVQTAARGSARGETKIRVLLAEDVDAVRKERGGVEPWHLMEIGWSRAELAAHLPAVCAELTAAA